MKKSAISQRRPEYVLPRIPKFNDITPLGAGGPGTLRAGHCVCDSLWPDGSAPNVVPYGEMPVWAVRERRVLGCIAGSQPEKHL